MSEIRLDAQLVKEQVSLREIFVADGHDLKKAGPGYYKTRCPFHQEDTASCVVHDRPENFFKCFGCNEGGSVFDYWMRTRSCTFSEAIKQLAGDFKQTPNVQRPTSNVESKIDRHEGVSAPMDGEVERSWDEAVERLREHPHRVKTIAEWRGYSAETVRWVNELGLIGIVPFMGVWREAFLVERPELTIKQSDQQQVSDNSRVLGEQPAVNIKEQEKALSAGASDGSPSPNLSGGVESDGSRCALSHEGNQLNSTKSRPSPAQLIPVGYHVRLGPKTAGNPGGKASWRYVPTGIGNWPFVLGDVATARVLFFMEGQWDALAFIDCMGWIGEKFPKNVAIVGMRGATSWKRFVEYYQWSDEVVAFVLGDADTAGGEWLRSRNGDSEDTFIELLRLRCKRVWCFYPKQVKDFNDLWKDRLVTRDQLVIWFRDKMRHQVKGRRAAGVTFLQFCKAQLERQDAIGEAARIILGDKKHRPTGRKPLKVWERYFHKYVPEQNRSAMYATWREWLRSRSGGMEKAA